MPNTLKVEVALWKWTYLCPSHHRAEKAVWIPGPLLLHSLSRSAKILKDGVFQTVGLNPLVSHAISSRPAYFLNGIEKKRALQVTRLNIVLVK